MALLFLRGRCLFVVLFSFVLLVVMALIATRHKDVSSVLDYQPYVRFFLPDESVNVKIDWKTVNINSLTPEQIIEYLMWTNQTSCKLSHDFGGKMLKNPSGFDGQKAVCLDTEVAPKAGSCIVYSFGINNEWSFDEAMESYGCKVFAFDPSMNTGNHQHSLGVTFYNFGLSGKDEVDMRGWDLKTLSSIYSVLKEKNQHADVNIDYLKIDIESAEWEVIPDIIRSGMLAKVRQLGVEFHLSRNTDLYDFYWKFDIIKSIEDAGMIRFDSKYNPWFKGKMPAMNNITESLGYEIAWYQILP
ncbi:probable methyltransferase-like protein 24 [Daphnia carinata]|uniref:probable methyltransferase-like protein 24 n=1 Tax=Daphnia carinata TaxID=120202 RepID=UPI00257DF4B0|nr:probable methyltransferase-like protein 24 [Daphnia carinata]